MTRGVGPRGEVVHEIVGGFCRVCGDTAEYLRDRGRDVVIDLTDAIPGLDEIAPS